MNNHSSLGRMLILGLLYGSIQTAEDSVPAVAEPPAPEGTATSRPRNEFRWRNQNHWVAEQVVGEMARWTSRVHGPARVRLVPAADGSTTYQTEGMVGTVKIAHHIWSAGDYLPLAKHLLGPPATPSRVESRAAADARNTTFAMVLLQPTTKILLALDGEVGRQLQGNPADPELHERAALLWATVAFREAAGRFNDPRRELSAATAHLALASVRQPTPGICARIAECTIDLVANRQVAALAGAQSLPAEGPLAGWRRAIICRAKGDWREALPKAGATLVEQLAYGRILAERLGDAAVEKWLDETEPLAMPDWGRLVLGARFSVGSGHRFAKPGLAEETTELAVLWSHCRGRDLVETDLSRALQLTDQPADPPRLIPLATWSALLARHRAFRVAMAHDFVAERLGMPEAAETLDHEYGKTWAADPMMPFVRMGFRRDPERGEWIRKAAALVSRDPGLLAAPLWCHFREQGDTAVAKSLLPQSSAWWTGIAPQGTALNAKDLSRQRRGTSPEDAIRVMEEANRLAPYDSQLLGNLAYKRPNHDAATLTATFGDLLEIDVQLAWMVAHEANPGEGQIAANRRLARLDANAFTDLGDALRAANRTPEAIAAYEDAFSQGTDRVKVASAMEWLVLYDVDHGNPKRAREIAAACARVGSAQGIATLAKLEERLGNLDAAENGFKRIEQAYDDSKELFAFYQRTAALRPSSRTALAAAMARLFPQGEQVVQLADCTGAPKDGAALVNESSRSRKFGLRQGHIIVAIDGIRCANQKQYFAIRDRSPGKPLALIVWDGKAYHEVVADVPERRLEVELADWTGNP